MRFPRRHSIFWLLLLALLIRLLIFSFVLLYQPNKFEISDLDGYVNIARNMLKDGIYSREVAPPFHIDITRPPLYPIVLAGLMLIGNFNGNLIVLFQIFLGVALIGLTFSLSRELNFDLRSSLIAVILVTLDPILILINHYFLSEPLFLLLLFTGLWIFSKFINNQRIVFLALSSGLLACGALTRPILQFFPVIIALPTLWLFSHQKSVVKIRNSILFLLIFLAILLPWMVRNKNVGGYFTLSPITEINLYFYRAKTVVADVENISQEAATEQLTEELNQTKMNQQLSISQVYVYMRYRAIQIMISHPAQTIKMTIYGTIRLLFDPGYSLVCTALDPNNMSPECFPGEANMLTGNIFQKMLSRFLTMNLFQKIVLIWSIILMVLTYFGAFLGAILVLRRNMWLAALLILGTIFYFVILSSGAESLYRLRMPLIPLIAILSGLYYSTLLNNWLIKFRKQQVHKI
jgi:4-amino-4-deoxy-L-arabinose transferase-like glycosyltransferase